MSGKELSDGFIPAYQWSSAILPVLNEGHALKLHFDGLSMYPLLVGGRDDVLIEAVSGKRLKRGDIVLYIRKDGMHVLHRIHHVEVSGYYMLGDAQTWIEGPIDEDDVRAVVTTIIRKGKSIECSALAYRWISELWLFMRSVRPQIIKIIHWVHRMRKS
ncbi:hypothetical protein UNSWDHB_1043 [Dehalobacter sp. UNSWDHB]|uniref:S26 family signal peptidase n=1 Tax=Dehalobacter sp. UNSWDHB TaxID=1339256 RepID=UPI00038D56CD|nr:S26 family signal peptidase [Dehalobacter sp. UNSWDHB]EQB21630.1 hypothetical protein UNSWDHB_1043 [Dehalobacter sp. UNSWDHB]